jgi:general L-amino acid transport system permease protein
VPERPAPVKTTGFIGFLRTRLFNSPTKHPDHHRQRAAAVVHPGARAENSPGGRGLDRRGPHRLPAESPGDVVGACWPFIQASFRSSSTVLSGAERWRVNLVFVLARSC